MKKLLLFTVLLSLLVYIANPVPVYATSANLSCSPATGTYNIGDTFTVDYLMDTRTYQAFGADIVATYDPAILDVVGTQSTPVTTTTNWGQPTANTVDTSLGKINLDYGQTQPAFTGHGSVGQITFKAKAAGQVQFNFVFFQQYDDTTPGVAKVWGKKDNVNLSNILTDVTNCLFVVAASVPTSTPAPAGPTSTPGPTVPPVTQLPRSGSSETTVGLLGLSLLFFVLGAVIPSLRLKD